MALRVGTWSLIGCTSTFVTTLIFLILGSTTSSVVVAFGSDALVNAFVVVVLFEKLPIGSTFCDEAKNVFSVGYLMGTDLVKNMSRPFKQLLNIEFLLQVCIFFLGF